MAMAANAAQRKWRQMHISARCRKYYQCWFVRPSGPRLYKTLGCFRDNWSRAIPTLEGRDAILDGGYQQRQDPTLKCYQAANRRRYKVFAVQNGGWCASSATAGETYDKYGPSSNCASDGEGGGWANQVYEIQGIPLKRHVLTNSSRKCLCLINWMFYYTADTSSRANKQCLLTTSMWLKLTLKRFVQSIVRREQSVTRLTRTVTRKKRLVSSTKVSWGISCRYDVWERPPCVDTEELRFERF